MAAACRAQEVQALRQCPEEAREVTDQPGRFRLEAFEGKNMSVVSLEGGRREKVCMLQTKQCGRAIDEREGIPTGTGSGVEGGSMWLRLGGDKVLPAL